jgi:protein-S-isoprenylcysteine O-methyltransferase Ste14
VSRYYPELLVTLQFGIIGLMLIFSHGVFDTIYPSIIFSIGLWLGIWALNHNQLGNFHIQPKLKEGSKLITTGIYRYIRHPMYTSVIIMMSSILIATPNLLQSFFLISLIVVLWLKATREESLWLEESSEYDKYKESSKLFIPYIL